MELDPKTADALHGLLEKANGKRKKHRLTLEDVELLIEEALASPHGLAVRHGGAEILAYTTIALGVVSPEKPGVVVVGIGYSSAEKPTPGRYWKELQPWMQDLSKNVEKAQKWAESSKSKDRVAVNASAGAKAKGTAAKKPKGNGAALLSAVLKNPQDDAARLVYADYLMMAGDPRGELISVQIALEKTPKSRVGERRKLLSREKDLLKKHRRTWTKEATQFASDCKIARGFVWQIEATCQAFANQGAGLFAHEPIEELVVSKPTGAGLAALGNAPHLAKLRCLSFGHDVFWLQTAGDVTKLNAFFRSDHLGTISKLRLLIGHDPYLREMPDTSNLFEGVAWKNVEELTLLTVPGLTGRMGPIAQSLAKAKLPALKKLTVGSLKPADKAVLAKAFPKATSSL